MMLSIITPSFRQVDYLARCAASVTDQAGDFECEHLVQDGGGGREFEAWAAGQSVADVVSEPDEGMYDAINRGFRRACGDILAWLNCDEQYLPGALDAVAAWFRSHPHHDILYGDVVLVSPDGTPLSYRQAVVPLRQHIRHCFLPTYSAATFVRRRVIDEGHFLDTRFRAIADAVWIHELLGAGYKPGVLNKPLAAFTQTGENLGQSPAGLEEARRWRAPKSTTDRIAAPVFRLCHQFRKLRAGAYRKHPIDTAIYLPGHAERQPVRAVLGGMWKR